MGTGSSAGRWQAPRSVEEDKRDYIIVAQRDVPQDDGRFWLEQVQVGAPGGYSSYEAALSAATLEQRSRGSTDAALTFTVRRRLSLSPSAI